MNTPSLIAKFDSKLRTSLPSSKFISNENLSRIFCDMAHNPFVHQGKAIPNEAREDIVERWLNGTTQRQIGKDLNISKSTVQNIIDNFSQCGHSNHEIGENKTRLARTEDVVTYIEFCKQQPSISAEEIQKKLVDNNVCLRENCPSKSSITRAVREDLGYSYKQLNVTARESLTENAEQRLLEYLTACSTIDPTSMHFFDECSVIKTTGNRRYGHSQIGAPAVEIQRYASNAYYTVNLLHSIFGISHVNVLNGPSNGLELLNFFAEAVEEKDVLENPVLKQGDTVIMDNCGFHHARHVEPALRNMLARNGCTLLFQPPYHPVYNTSEYCFHALKGWLRKNTDLTENHTVVAIYDGLSRITPVMSRNFFRHCGYTL